MKEKINDDTKLDIREHLIDSDVVNLCYDEEEYDEYLNTLNITIDKLFENRKEIIKLLEI